MKIDEADINHNAVCLIHKALKEYELYYDHPEANVKAMTEEEDGEEEHHGSD